MKKYKIVTLSNNYWSSRKLKKEVEELLNTPQENGYEFESLSFGTNLWYVPTAYILYKLK